MHPLALILALTSIITNSRVAVTDGKDTGTRSHDTVVVDPKTATAQFVKAGTPGFTKFSPRGRIHQEELVKGKSSAVMVELK